MIPAGVRIYVCTQATDMRRSFDGLEIAVRNGLGLDPRSGGLFIFFNRRADQLRILFWDRNGYAIFAKRLDCARFRRNSPEDNEGHLEIDSQKLLRMLDDVVAVRPRKQANRTIRPNLRLLDSVDRTQDGAEPKNLLRPKE